MDTTANHRGHQDNAHLSPEGPCAPDDALPSPRAAPAGFLSLRGAAISRFSVSAAAPHTLLSAGLPPLRGPASGGGRRALLTAEQRSSTRTDHSLSVYLPMDV